MLAKKSPLLFFRQVQEAMVMAFATASSNARLPTALRVADKELKLPPKVARFVLTIGATANQNGPAMVWGVTDIFPAQFFGVDLHRKRIGEGKRWAVRVDVGGRRLIKKNKEKHN